jgi:hypothetical protein
MTVVGRGPLPDEFRGTWLCALGGFVVRVSRGPCWTLATIHVWRPAVAIGNIYGINGEQWGRMGVHGGWTRSLTCGSGRDVPSGGGFSYSVVGALVHSNLLLHTSRSRTGCGTAPVHQKVTSHGDDGRGMLGPLPNLDLARHKGPGCQKRE